MSLENKLNGARELIENFQTHNYRLNVLPSKWDILKKSSDSINCIGSIGAAKFDFDKLYEKYKQNNYDSNAEIERDFNRLKNYARSYFGGFWSLVANTLEVLALTQFPEEKLFKKHKDGRKTLKGKKFKKLLEKNNKELYDILYQESDFKRNLRHPLSHWSEKDIIKDNGEKPKKESKFNISYENYLKNRTNIFEYDMDFFNKKSYIKMFPKTIKEYHTLYLKLDSYNGERVISVKDLNGNKHDMKDIMLSIGLNSIEKIIKVYKELNK